MDQIKEPPLFGTVPPIFVIDDDSEVRECLREMLEENGRVVEVYPSGTAFLEAYKPGREGCILVDARMPGMGGVELLRQLRDGGRPPPAIMISGNGDVSTAVEAMKAGAADFLEKPIHHGKLIECIGRALDRASASAKEAARQDEAAARLAGLTKREREIMEMVLAGDSSKNIAADLGINQRTVENHRAKIMHKTGTRSLPALARLALFAGDGRQLA
jgi:two-component system, chemotaxis family, CheB/CheR fusion protein